MGAGRRLAVVGAAMSVALILPLSIEATADPCETIQRLIDTGQLDLAEFVGETMIEDCGAEILVAIDEQRGSAAALMSRAERRYEAADTNGTLNDAGVRSELLASYAQVAALDRDHDGVSDRLAELGRPKSTTTTTTTTTTVALQTQVERLRDLGLNDKARDRAAEGVATGTIPDALQEDIDDTPSFDERLRSSRDSTFDWLVPLALAAIAAVALWIVVLAGAWLRRLLKGQLGQVWSKVAIPDATGDLGAEFSSALRALLAGESPWSGVTVARVSEEVEPVPTLGDLSEHLKPVDWFLSKFVRRRWVMVTATLHTPDSLGAAVTLELTGPIEARATLRTEPLPQPEVEKSAPAQQLAGVAACWLLHQLGEESGGELGIDWRSRSATYSGLHHLQHGDADRAIESFANAVQRSAENLAARHNLLYQLGERHQGSPDVLEHVYTELDDLARAAADKPESSAIWVRAQYNACIHRLNHINRLQSGGADESDETSSRIREIAVAAEEAAIRLIDGIGVLKASPSTGSADERQDRARLLAMSERMAHVARAAAMMWSIDDDTATDPPSGIWGELEAAIGDGRALGETSWHVSFALACFFSEFHRLYEEELLSDSVAAHLGGVDHPLEAALRVLTIVPVTKQRRAWLWADNSLETLRNSSLRERFTDLVGPAPTVEAPEPDELIVHLVAGRPPAPPEDPPPGATGEPDDEAAADGRAGQA